MARKCIPKSYYSIEVDVACLLITDNRNFHTDKDQLQSMIRLEFHLVGEGSWTIGLSRLWSNSTYFLWSNV